MKNLNSNDVNSVSGGLAFTGGDWEAFQDMMRRMPWLLSVN